MLYAFVFLYKTVRSCGNGSQNLFLIVTFGDMGKANGTPNGSAEFSVKSGVNGNAKHLQPVSTLASAQVWDIYSPPPTNSLKVSTREHSSSQRLYLAVSLIISVLRCRVLSFRQCWRAVDAELVWKFMK